MTDTLKGRYFFPGSARFVTARAMVQDESLRVEDEAGAILANMSLGALQVSPRLGNLPRRFMLFDGASFETDDNDAADLLLRGKRKGATWMHRLERSWRWAGISVVLAGMVVYFFVVYGIPAAALWLAEETPPAAKGVITKQALQVLDGTLLAASKLREADRQKAQMLFARVAALGKRGPGDYRLLLRSSPQLGPNALSLPDGTIVMTDELWSMVKADDEIEGVFAHEIAHVDRAHSLQSLYQAAMIPAAIAVVTGDISQISQVATVLPGILVQAAYSRGLEQQADDDAASVVKRLGGNPAHMADLLERLQSRLCANSTCPPSWLGTHPDTELRALRLRNLAATKKPAD
jgi:Zn-dependent protease with chaperone function